MTTGFYNVGSDLAKPVQRGEFDQLAEAFWRGDAARAILRDQHYDMLDGLPIGAGVPYFGAESGVRKDYLVAAGQEVSYGTYPDLGKMFGTTYGTATAAGHFKMPDLRGRIPVALDNMGGTDAGRLAAANTLGGTGGAETHTLTTTEMPVHNHGVTDPTHTHANGTLASQHVSTTGAGAVGGPTNAIPPHNGTSSGQFVSSSSMIGGVAVNATGITINNAGSGGSHNNMQPYVLVNFIIKALRYPR